MTQDDKQYEKYDIDHRGSEFAQLINLMRSGDLVEAKQFWSRVDPVHWEEAARHAIAMGSVEMLQHFFETIKPEMQSCMADRLAFGEDCLGQQPPTCLAEMWPLLSVPAQHGVLVRAATGGHVGAARLAMERGVDPHHSGDLCFKEAAEHGHVEVLTILLEHTEPLSLGPDAIHEAAANGHLDAVKTLLPFTDPIGEQYALSAGCIYGYVEVVQFLLQGEAPQSQTGNFLKLAAGNGHFDVVNVLLPFMDPKCFLPALIAAASYKQSTIIDFLYPLCDEEDLVQMLEQASDNHEDDYVWFQEISMRLSAHNSKKGLEQHLGSDMGSSIKPKKM